MTLPTSGNNSLRSRAASSSNTSTATIEFASTTSRPMSKLMTPSTRRLGATTAANAASAVFGPVGLAPHLEADDDHPVPPEIALTHADPPRVLWQFQASEPLSLTNVRPGPLERPRSPAALAADAMHPRPPSTAASRLPWPARHSEDLTPDAVRAYRDARERARRRLSREPCRTRLVRPRRRPAGAPGRRRA
jgi:hypothetical protein